MRAHPSGIVSREGKRRGRRKYPAFLLALTFLLMCAGVPEVAAQNPQATAKKRVSSQKPSAKATPNDSPLATLGQAKEKQRQFNAAEELYRKAIDASPSNVFGYTKLGSLLVREERTDEAIAVYEALLKIRPSSTQAKAQLAALYERSGRAKDSLQMALSIPVAARPAKLLPVMAADYIALNQPEETQKLIGEILRQCAADPTLVPQLATLFLRQKMAGDANELMRIAAARQKITPEFLAVLARVQAANGNSEEANATLARALAMDSSQPEALLAQALQQGGSGDWKGAVASLNKSRQIAPPTDEILRRLAYACLQTDDLMTAHDAAIELYDRNPRRSDSAFTLAIVFVRASHWGEAKPLLQQVLGETPNDKRAQLALGIVQFNLGDIANAQRLLSASLGQGQSDAEAHYMLGLIVKQNGDFAAAAARWKQRSKSTLRSRRPFRRWDSSTCNSTRRNKRKLSWREPYKNVRRMRRTTISSESPTASWVTTTKPARRWKRFAGSARAKFHNRRAKPQVLDRSRASTLSR